MAAVAYYSRSGHTEALAETVAEAAGCRPETIVPRVHRSYPVWLALSFVPGSTVKIRSPSQAPDDDLLYLGSPKWTVSCPPVNGYLASRDVGDLDIALFTTHAGFHVDGFLDRTTRTVERQGASVAAELAVHRDDVWTEDTREEVERFVSRAREGSGRETPTSREVEGR